MKRIMDFINRNTEDQVSDETDRRAPEGSVIAPVLAAPINMGAVLTRMDSLTEGGFRISVVTGDRRGAGTDANVWIRLHDVDGRKSPVITLNHTFKNDHERGETSSFSVKPVLSFGTLEKVELWRDTFGFGHAWFVDRIEVLDMFSGELFVFPFHRWVPPDIHFFVGLYDCVLPHSDPHQTQRRDELRRKRQLYRYKAWIPDGPTQSYSLPEDERFSHEYKWDIVSMKARMMVETKLIKIKVFNWESMEDLRHVYKYSLGEPKSLDHWNEDRWFGLQRVQGVNPFLIQLCTEIPEKFAVTADMVEPFLEGLTLEMALVQKKIFMTDVSLVEGVELVKGGQLWGAMALFFLNKRDDLMPIAIQCWQNPGPDNPVFLPSDPPRTWIAAKMFYNNSDASFHQSCSHLGFTHLLMEGVTVCSHRNLSPSHPLFKLMAPHFLFLIAINSRGLSKLISPGGWVDKTLSVGVSGMFEIIRRGLEIWKLEVRGNPERDIESRGVLSKDVLPWYPYRDDAIRIYKAIRRYVSKIVHYYYASPDSLENDYELQQWRDELVKERHLTGVGLKGVPGEANGRFTTLDEVIDTVAAIINQCSVGHAAANFQQYEDYAFPPNYPAFLDGMPPTDKREYTEDDLVKLLPSKEATLDSMIITKLLSSKGTNSLGDFEVQYMYEPEAVDAARQFREDLRKISDEIKARNAVRDLPYPYLDPEIVPNSISI
ncbi:polyunsaturated fatty acid 5-lipoxygenase-like isoform X2 [Ornithodoros turicata]|uniref:polyunsaturated fatty acid 5-lipoxygenase-like isoform X2 n=1 Tax=Ornithodoros turicata TaxID=34597 RepID=UPI003139263F